MLSLRDYQNDSINELRFGFAAGHRAQMLYLTTGGGKTEIAISMMDSGAKKGKRSAMIVDRRILCDQTSARLHKYGIDHGVMMAGHPQYRPDKLIQICSAQTLEAMGSFPDVDFLVIDEAHCTRDSVKKFISNRPDIKVVGLSASPFTKGLGKIYTNVVSKVTTKELVEQGSLAPIRVFICKEIDMDGAKKVAGEWSAKDVTERGAKVSGDIVSEWIKKTHEIFGAPKKTIVFCAGVAHGEELSRKFAEAGYNFVAMSYRDDNDFKQDVIKDFSRPDTDIHGLIATDILTKGFDDSGVMIGISARPFTKSFSSHVQQLGRVMRPHPDKPAIWLDHSGNFLRFHKEWEQLYEEGVHELHEGMEKPKSEPKKEEKEAAKCHKCGAFWPPKTDVCPHCGAVRVRRNDVISVPGAMTELIAGNSAGKYDSATKERWYRELLQYGRSKGYQDGWAYHQYLSKFKVLPVWKKDVSPVSTEVYGWIKSRQIAHAKAKKTA